MSGIDSPRPPGPLPGAGTAAPTNAPVAVREAPAGLRAAQPGTTLKATVIGRDGAGHLMLRTSRGLLVLAARLNPPVGAEVTLQLRPAGAQIQAYILNVRAPAGAAPSGTPTPAATAAPALPHADPSPAPRGDAHAPAPVLTRAWPALHAAMLALQRPGGTPRPEDAANALTSPGNPIGQAIPRPGPALASGLLFLMVAIKGGDLGRWLGGQPLRALERLGRGDLVRQLRGDFRQLAGMARDAGDDWRLFVLPLLGDEEVRPLRLFLRRHDGDGDDFLGPDGDPPPARFVVELALSRLGELQLDGLARGQVVEAILRSRHPLPEPLRARLEAAFVDNLGAAGAHGRLSFHPGDDWGFLPVPGQDAHADGLRV